jgi:hypothetical protein
MSRKLKGIVDLEGGLVCLEFAHTQTRKMQVTEDTHPPVPCHET